MCHREILRRGRKTYFLHNIFPFILHSTLKSTINFLYRNKQCTGDAEDINQLPKQENATDPRAESR